MASPPENVKERIRASYNGTVKEYNAWTAQHHHIRQVYLDELLQRCPALSTPAAEGQDKQLVLELGCGSGQPFLTDLLTRCPTVHAHANDISDGQMDLARTNLAPFEGRVDFHVGDMTKLEFASGSLAAVVGLYSIIHLPQEDQVTMLQLIGKWLRPGGILVANFGLEETKGVVMDKWLGEEDWQFWSALGKDGTVEAINKAGMEVDVAKAEGDEKETFLWIIAKKKE